MSDRHRQMDVDMASELARQIIEQIKGVVIADDDVLEEILAGLLAKGHVLLEDVPGTGKTLTARSIARSLGLSFSRIQFTPDLLPSDITGTKVFNEHEATFEFQRGPLFGNVILADELNRASPKTQAALLEAMEEGQVTVAGDTYDLPEPFFVIATQNPVEQEGTFPLPIAQKDRFIVKTSLGYPDESGAYELLQRRLGRTDTTPIVQQIDTDIDVSAFQNAPEEVDVDPDLCRYIVSLVEETRDHDAIRSGVSPRGMQRLLETARALATVRGRTYVVPDDVKDAAHPTLQHRLLLTGHATVESTTRESVLDDVLQRVGVPTVSDDPSHGDQHRPPE